MEKTFTGSFTPVLRIGTSGTTTIAWSVPGMKPSGRWRVPIGFFGMCTRT